MGVSMGCSTPHHAIVGGLCGECRWPKGGIVGKIPCELGVGIVKDIFCQFGIGGTNNQSQQGVYRPLQVVTIHIRRIRRWMTSHDTLLRTRASGGWAGGCRKNCRSWPDGADRGDFAVWRGVHGVGNAPPWLPRTRPWPPWGPTWPSLRPFFQVVTCDHGFLHAELPGVASNGRSEAL